MAGALYKCFFSQELSPSALAMVRLSSSAILLMLFLCCNIVVGPTGKDAL
jgi:hypothetical protein